ncbi:hypothetical protein PoB_002864400 [Plakobranchus ocellatus]|uniref:Uncharacterized protein n=1 Tax=Plakobranchus ocellatus TaxID=259542 RepID=A0AAV4A6F5_9GAST|nr:hypothetical protein PoB_002864400 [Plakobranchus ocellatus]
MAGGIAELKARERGRKWEGTPIDGEPVHNKVITGFQALGQARARTRDRTVPAYLRVDSLVTVPPKPLVMLKNTICRQKFKSCSTHKYSDSVKNEKLYHITPRALPCNIYHLFGSPKRYFGGRKSECVEELIEEVLERFSKLDAKFFRGGYLFP